MRALYLLRNSKPSSSFQVRWCVSKAKFKLEDELEKKIDDEKLKPRHHPGIIKNTVAALPEWVVGAMDDCLDGDVKPQLLKEHMQFSNYLFSRRLPIEQYELKNKYLEIEAEYLPNPTSDQSEEELQENRKKIKHKVEKKLKEKVFCWKSLEYNNYRSLLYMITRSAPEYSVLNKIFNEIQTRDPEFNPETIFDFGSGVGSVFWAANTRWKNIKEYMGVDISNDMNDLSQQIIDKSPKKPKGVFYRQYLPVSNVKFDLIVSAYSLMEMHDSKSRLEVISKLWRKTNKYLVIVEQGTNAGFKLVNEARDFIKHVMDNFEKSSYYTFAPCPHDQACPRFQEGQTPCNFIVNYFSLPLLGNSKSKKELFSYVVLRKDSRKEVDNWYRAVRPTLIRSKHARCRFCTSEGKLKEIVFTASKYGKSLYRCARATDWGDRLAIQPNSATQTENTEILDNGETEFKDKNEKCLVSRSPLSIKEND